MRKLLITIIFLFITGTILGAELGAGGGSGYPAAIDTDTIVETSTHTAREDVPNDLADAIVNIETELGINPAGSYDTVNDRFDLFIDSTTDQSIDGYKTFNDSVTVTGLLVIPSKTEAELKAFTPDSARIIYYDSTNKAVVVSTGTGQGEFGLITNGASSPTGW